MKEKYLPLCFYNAIPPDIIKKFRISLSIIFTFSSFHIFRIEEETGDHSLERVLRGHDPGPQEPSGVGHLQEDSREHPVCQGHSQGEDIGNGGGHRGIRLLSEYELCFRRGQNQNLHLDVPAVVRRCDEGAKWNSREWGWSQDPAIVKSVKTFYEDIITIKGSCIFMNFLTAIFICTFKTAALQESKSILCCKYFFFAIHRLKRMNEKSGDKGIVASWILIQLDWLSELICMS